MKKRIFTLLVALVLCATAMFSVAAVTPVDAPYHDVHISNTNMQVRYTGTDANWAESSSVLYMTTADMNTPVDFRVKLNVAPIKNAIIDWYEYGKKLIDAIATDATTNTIDAALKAHLTQYFNEWAVTGQFVVTIKFPAQFSGTELDKHFDTTRKDMYGFNDGAKDLFEEVSRSVTDSGNTKVLTITVKIKDFFPNDDTKDGIVEQNLYDGVMNGTYLSELTYTAENITAGAFSGSLSVYGNMTGYTDIEIGNSSSQDDRVNFYTNDQIVATLRVRTYPTPGDGPSTPPSKDYKLEFVVDGDSEFIDPIYGNHFKYEDLPKPKKPGYTFVGWYYDSELTQKVEGDVTITKDTKLYAHWMSDTLHSEDHFAYVIGYPDGTVRPNNNITREETAMMFYRLLRDEVREAAFTTTNSFSDVEAGRWSNNAISTMANGGYIVGRPDGSFDPEANITRAEFATMTVRFAQLMDDSGIAFSDISGHWAEKFILKAATAKWINGYPDGTFKPDAYITRAEAMTLVNTVLARKVDKTGLHANATLWIDLNESDWYYYIVLEATNSHHYTRQVDGLTENWTAIVPNKTWK